MLEVKHLSYEVTENQETHHSLGLPDGFASLTPPLLAPGFPFPAQPFPLCPHSSVT